MSELRRRVIDGPALRALAHPLRVRMLEELSVQGSATASELGRRLGESSGVTSYHLRHLEKQGFVEEDAGRGNRRERWWRVPHESTSLRGRDFEDDPAMAEAERMVAGEWSRARAVRLQQWLSTRREWTGDWREVGHTSDSHLLLTAAEAEEMFTELNELVTSWAGRVIDRDDLPTPPDGARRVEIQVNLFPSGSPPGDKP